MPPITFAPGFSVPYQGRFHTEAVDGAAAGRARPETEPETYFLYVEDSGEDVSRQLPCQPPPAQPPAGPGSAATHPSFPHAYAAADPGQTLVEIDAEHLAAREA